jgi:hypothetical protein
MAFSGGTFGDGAATGTTAVTLESILGASNKEFKQVDIRAATANTGAIYIGPSTVAATDAYVELAAGESWGLNPGGFDAAGGSQFEIDPALVYVVGTAVADQAFVAFLR